MADLKYPFKLAAWKTARFLMHPDEKTDQRNTLIQAGVAGLMAVAGTFTLANISPDDTAIDGQDQRISVYEEKIDQLDQYYDNTIEEAREEWRMSSDADRDAAENNLQAANDIFQERAIDLLSGLYTENGISETETHALLEQFEEQIGDVSSFEFNGESFPNIGDAAYLHEAQSEHAYTGNEHERALDIANTAFSHDKNETVMKVMSPLLGVTGGLMYILLIMLLDGAGLYKHLNKVSSRPAPQKNRSGHMKH